MYFYKHHIPASFPVRLELWNIFNGENIGDETDVRSAEITVCSLTFENAFSNMTHFLFMQNWIRSKV